MSHTKNKHLRELFERHKNISMPALMEQGVFLDGYNRLFHVGYSGTISTRIDAGCDWWVIVEDRNDVVDRKNGAKSDLQTD